MQDLGYYSVTTTLLHSKISIFTKCTNLLLALIETESAEFKKAQMEEMINQIDIENLKRKMVDIFTYKIGVSSKRERIYYSNKVRIRVLIFGRGAIISITQGERELITCA